MSLGGKGTATQSAALIHCCHPTCQSRHSINGHFRRFRAPPVDGSSNGCSERPGIVSFEQQQFQSCGCHKVLDSTEIRSNGGNTPVPCFQQGQWASLQTATGNYYQIQCVKPIREIRICLYAGIN